MRLTVRRFFWLTGCILATLLLSYAYQVWNNNRNVDVPETRQYDVTLEKAISWLEQNRDRILTTGNPVLWYLIQRSAEITDDRRLQDLFAAYDQRYLENRRNIWRPMFHPGTWVPVRFEDISGFSYYNWYFIYAILCDKKLGDVPAISAQNDTSFCDQHPFKPACVTHQLMGIRFLQRSGCGDPEQLRDKSRRLQDRIYRQLILDPRVVDVYMQRVLMLVESGAGKRIKPVWIRNLVEAQQADGGWSPHEPLLPLGGGYQFGYGPNLFSLSRPRSSFHTTAQGVLLFSLLARDARNATPER